MKHKNNVYKEQILNQLETLQSSNPKEYWNLIHKLQDTDKEIGRVKIEPDMGTMIQHYEKLNVNNTEYTK